MSCPQCQAVNGPDAAFCGGCGTRLPVASAPAGAGGYPPSPGGYPPSPGGPASYGPAAAPGGYNPPDGYGAAPGYGNPGYQSPPPGYGPAGGQAPDGYMQNPYQQGQYQPGAFQQRSSATALPPVNFDLNRLTTADKVVAGATFVTLISLWLPWFSAPYLGSFSGTGDHGWLWLEFLLALALIVYLAARAAWDQLPFSLPIEHDRLLMIGTGVQFLLIMLGFLVVPAGSGIPGYSYGWDFGAFLALIGAVVAAGLVFYPPAKAYLDNRKAA